MDEYRSAGALALTVRRIPELRGLYIFGLSRHMLVTLIKPRGQGYTTHSATLSKLSYPAPAPHVLFSLHSLFAISLHHLPSNRADPSLESDSGAICSCEVSVQDCLDRLAELNSVRGCIGRQRDVHTKRHHVLFSGPGRPNPMLHKHYF
jgi:hypothetical protein